MTLNPPTARTSYGYEVAKFAGKGLTLQVCDSCDNILYPHRELCTQCLGDTISWKKVAGKGTLLARVVLARSFDEWFAEQLPWLLVTVRLQAGVSLICHAHPDLGNGENTKVSTVNVQVCIDAGGSGVLVAMPEATANERFSSLDAAINWPLNKTQETRSIEE